MHKRSLKWTRFVGDFTALAACGRPILCERARRWNILMQLCLSLKIQNEICLQEGLFFFPRQLQHTGKVKWLRKNKTKKKWNSFMNSLQRLVFLAVDSPTVWTICRSAVSVWWFYHLMSDNVDGVGVCSFIWSHRALCVNDALLNSDHLPVHLHRCRSVF